MTIWTQNHSFWSLPFLPAVGGFTNCAGNSIIAYLYVVVKYDYYIPNWSLFCWLSSEGTLFSMSVQYQERYRIMFVVSPQHHSQNGVHVSLDTQKFLYRPPLCFFVEWSPAQFCIKGTWKQLAHISATFSTKLYFSRRTARPCVVNGSPRQ